MGTAYGLVQYYVGLVQYYVDLYVEKSTSKKMEKIGEISIMSKFIPPYVSFTVNICKYVKWIWRRSIFLGLQCYSIPVSHGIKAPVT